MATTSSPSRVAIVTGAAQGIGRAIALRLAADGLAVVVSDIAPKADVLDALVAEISAAGGAAAAASTDVREEAQVQALVARAVEVFGRLDVMVANAGVGTLPQSILELDIANVQAVYAVNVLGVVHCYKHAALQMVKQGGGGRLIGAASTIGKRGYAYLAPYSMSKFAVRAVTQTSALELLEHGITVNAYAPGIIETAMTTSFDPETAAPTSTLKTLMKTPDAITGQPENVASLVSYLAKPESSHINGQSITVDGGSLFD